MAIQKNRKTERVVYGWSKTGIIYHFEVKLLKYEEERAKKLNANDWYYEDEFAYYEFIEECNAVRKMTLKNCARKYPDLVKELKLDHQNRICK